MAALRGSARIAFGHWNFGILVKIILVRTATRSPTFPDRKVANPTTRSSRTARTQPRGKYCIVHSEYHKDIGDLSRQLSIDSLARSPGVRHQLSSRFQSGKAWRLLNNGDGYLGVLPLISDRSEVA